MKLLKKLGVAGLILIIVSLLAISSYGIGEDLISVLPPWFLKVFVGAGAVIVSILIGSVFACGIIHIKGILG